MSATSIIGWVIIGATMSLAMCFLIAWSVSNGGHWACAIWRYLRRPFAMHTTTDREEPDRAD